MAAYPIALKPRSRRLSALISSILALAALAGCQSVPVTSLPALSRIDPFTMDPTALRAAVVHAPAVRFPDGSMVITMDLSIAGGAEQKRETFVLVSDDAPVELASTKNHRVSAFKLAPDDGARVRALQALMRDLRARKVEDNTFAVAVSLKPCLTAPAQNAEVAAFLKPSSEGSYVAVHRGLPVDQLTDGTVPQCQGPPS
ncbi:MAG: hypothetical protein AAGB11_07210 [Pseudomonadota bacterium]